MPNILYTALAAAPRWCIHSWRHRTRGGLIKRRHCLLALALSVSPMGRAQPASNHAGEMQDYLVSAMLRGVEGGFVITVAHASHSARSPQEASGLFTEALAVQYPGYSVLNTVATAFPPSELACAPADAGSDAGAAQSYVITTIWRKGSTGFEAVLVHGLMFARSPDAALGQFMAQAGARYPQHTLFKSLVTERRKTLRACDVKDRPMEPPLRRPSPAGKPGSWQDDA